VSRRPAMPVTCPACGGRIRVTGLCCSQPGCGTEVRGEFEVNEFALLPPEPLEFLRLYIKTRGNLKEVERILGVSYPTVRARMEQLLRSLGYEVPDEPISGGPSRSDILQALEQGQISPAEAAEQLRAAAKR
jgi:hypothetical protein